MRGKDWKINIPKLIRVAPSWQEAAEPGDWMGGGEDYHMRFPEELRKMPKLRSGTCRLPRPSSHHRDEIPWSSTPRTICVRSSWPWASIGKKRPSRSWLPTEMWRRRPWCLVEGKIYSVVLVSAAAGAAAASTASTAASASGGSSASLVV